MKSRKKFWFYLRSYRYQSLLSRNFVLIFVIFILPMTVMGVIVYQNMNRIVEREVSTISMDSLLNMKGTIDTVLRDADIIATQISIQDEVRVFLMSELSVGELGQRYSEVHNTMKTFPLSHRYIDTIYIYSNKNNIVLSTRDSGPLDRFTDISWYEVYSKKEDNLPWIQARVKNNMYPYYISVVRPAYLYDETKLGAVIVNINAEELAKMIGGKNEQELKNVFIIDEHGTVIFNYDWENMTQSIDEIPLFQEIPLSQDTRSQMAVIQDEKYIISTVIDPDKKWRYISLISLAYYSERVDWVQSFLFNIFIFGVVIAIVIAVYLSYKSFEPIRYIIHLIESPEEWRYPRKNKGMNELKYIATNIVKMVSSNKQLQRELESRLTMLDKAHTTALQAQINPHFLYNTLESINWLAALSMGKTNKVSEMISNLSRLLRLSLESDEEITTIEKEMEHAKCYISIMKIRHADKFDVIWDIPSSLYTYKIIKLCFQPVIENALYHGLKHVKQLGIIEISGKLDQACIVIEVRDGGKGLSEEQMADINKGLENDYILKTEHIGLRNIAQRIKIVFGEEYGISLRKGIPNGLSVIMKIPIRK